MIVETTSSLWNILFKCKIYTEHRIQLFRGMRNLGFEIDIENILFGNPSFENVKTPELFLLVQKYIFNSKGFVLYIYLHFVYVEYTSDDDDLVYTFPYLCL